MTDPDFIRMLDVELARHTHRLPCLTVVIGLLVLFFLWSFHKMGAI